MFKGHVRLLSIDGQALATLIDEMIKDNCPFIWSLGVILDAFRNDQMYGLALTENEEGYDKLEIQNKKKYCCKYGSVVGQLPCFIVLHYSGCCDKVDFLWVHSRARKLGLGRELVTLCKVRFCVRPLAESREFWDKLDIGPEGIDFRPTPLDIEALCQRLRTTVSFPNCKVVDPTDGDLLELDEGAAVAVKLNIKVKVKVKVQAIEYDYCGGENPIFNIHCSNSRSLSNDEQADLLLGIVAIWPTLKLSHHWFTAIGWTCHQYLSVHGAQCIVRKRNE